MNRQIAAKELRLCKATATLFNIFSLFMSSEWFIVCWRRSEYTNKELFGFCVDKSRGHIENESLKFLVTTHITPREVNDSIDYENSLHVNHDDIIAFKIN